jgi:hypothetical protein
MKRIVLLLSLLSLVTACGTHDDGDDDDDDTGLGLPTGLWEGCPDGDAWVGDEQWSHRIEVTETALYCSTWYEGRTLEQELAMKGQMRWVAGEYALPIEATDEPMSLPICFSLTDRSAPEMGEAGTVQAQTSTYQETAYYSHHFKQPFHSGDGEEYQLMTYMNSMAPEGTVPDPTVMDGSASPFETGSTYDFRFWLCDEGARVCDGSDHPYDYQFRSCQGLDYATLSRGVIGFEGGDVTLELRIGASSASTEPAAFVSAQGTLDGTSFEQTDYYKLIYTPGHHHMTRAYAVLFDVPIGDACGLKISNMGEGMSEGFSIHTVDCALAHLEPREMMTDSWENEHSD